MDDDLFYPCREVIISVLRRGRSAEGSFFVLAGLARNAEPSGKVRVISCLGSSGSREAVSFLLDFLMDTERSVKAAAIGAIGELGISDSRICSKVRRCLRGRDLYSKKQAALTLGRLKDWESVSSLIDLLEDDNSGLARSAHWALQNITGLKFQLNQSRWASWWDKESENH